MKLNKIIGLVLLSIASDIYADDAQISDFQSFDDQISLFYGYSSSSLSNANNSGISQTSTNQSIGLDVEKLYDNHVWFNINGSFDVSTTQSNSQPFVGSVQNLGFPASLTGKVGYSFLIPGLDRFQVVPYATTGITLNYNGMNVPDVGFNHSYYYVMGGGAFIEYIAVKDKLSLYFDQKFAYLDDQSGITANQDAMNYVSTLGLKYNASSKVQLGIEGYYNQISMVNSSGGYDPVTYSSINNNQNTYGGIFSIGYLYDRKNTSNNTSGISFIDDDFRDFDNVYSLGYGYSVSHNSNVKTNLNYLDLNINHLFDNQVWVNLNGQLATNISQVNGIDTRYANYAPTYLTYPGSATTNLGYAFVLVNDKLQLIPYANAGIVMNINAYTISENQSVSSQLSNDMYLQYGGGARLEYVLNKDFQLYYDQLFAGLSDRSGLGLGLFKSNSVVGVNYHVYEPLQVGFALNYQNLSPTGSPSSQVPQPVLLNQSTLGGLISLGLRY